MSIAQYFAESIFPEFMGRRCHWKDIDPHSLGVFEPSLAIDPESQGARSLENAEITRSRIKEVHVKSANCAMGVIRKREKFQGELDRRSPFVSGGRGCSHVCARARAYAHVELRNSSSKQGKAFIDLGIIEAPKVEPKKRGRPKGSKNKSKV